jgi:hypothetical protein
VSRRRPTAVRRVALLALLLPALAGCIGLPSSGPVVETGSQGSLDEQAGIYIDPKPPQPGDLPADVVAGFLDAMTATPIQTNTAQEFLTREAQGAWNPEARTITYAEPTNPRGSSVVTVRLRGADHLDARCSYLGRLPAEDRVLKLPMERENGEWRIARPPNALIVPASWFEQRFSRMSLYFFDPSARILVPEPVFVPRGEQLPTALTDALLEGPGRELADVLRSFIPPDLSFGLSVPVSDQGVAELTLRGFSGQLDAEASERMLAQLVWTLRQEPSIQAVRVTLGGQPLSLPGGLSEFRVDEGAAYDPTGLQASSLLYGLRDGRLVAGPPDGLAAVDGPMGTSDLGVRTAAVNLTATTVAGVSAAGDRVQLSPVRGPGDRVVQVVSGGRQLLRPAWDFSDRLWLVEAAEEGARVSFVDDRRPRSLVVPGITGERVSKFLVSRDGSRLVAVARHPRGDRLLVSRIRRDGDGRVLGATPATRVSWDGESGLRIRDIGWTSPTSVAVLHRAARELYQIRTLSVDGSPSEVDDLLATLPERVRALAASPDPSESLFAITPSSLFDPRGESSGAQLEPDVTDIDYVG